jgi:hypothetical protein
MKHKTKLSVFPFILLAVLFMLTNSCTKEEKAEPVVVTDQIFYEQLGSAIIKCYSDVYNQNLAGKPTGNQNITGSGPMGGSVVISGSDSYDNTHGITMTSLIFTMNKAAYSNTILSVSGNTRCTTEIALTGATTYNGSFSDTYTSLNYQSQNLHVKGSVTYAGTVRNIDQTGQVTINRSSKISANIFGNSVSW